MESQKAIVTQAAQKYGVDPKILWGLYGTETSFGKNVSTSSAGAVGPFQFEPATARGMGVNPLDFKSAAYGAARYLSQYKNRGVAGMLSAYNAGPAGGLQQGYVDTTLKNAQTYGSAPNLPVAEAKAPGITAIPGAPKAETPALPTFDKAGFEKAQKAAVVGKLLASEGGAKENPLLLTGVATTQAPVKSEYESEKPTGTVIAEHKGSPIVKVTEGPNAGKTLFIPKGTPDAKGAVGFTAGPGTDYSYGKTPEIAQKLNALGKALGVKLTGISGYRTPQHSVAVGGFADDPHTKGLASDTEGTQSIPKAVLNKYGLERPFPGAKEADHIQLLHSVNADGGY